MLRNTLRTTLLALGLIAMGGCYHATINTGVAPGSNTIQRPWAMSFIYGLVPPSTVNAVEECGSDGVARVETKHSFLNALVGGITFGIVTPMNIQVTCGAGEEDEQFPEVDDQASLKEALESGEAFLIRFN